MSWDDSNDQAPTAGPMLDLDDLLTRGDARRCVRPAPDRRRTADDAHPRVDGADGGHEPARGARPPGLPLRRPHREPAQDLRGDARARHGPLGRRGGAVPRQRLLAARGRRRRAPHDPVGDQAAREPRHAAGAEHLRQPQARPGARHRSDRVRQVDDARGDHRPGQPHPARTHRHHRGPDRVPPHPQGLHRQPARGGRRHPELPPGAQARAAAGPRRDPRRRDARPRHDLGGHQRRRDRPPGAGDAAHPVRPGHRQPRHRRLPERSAAAGPHPAGRDPAGRGLPGARALDRRQGPRARRRGHGVHRGHPVDDPGRQAAADPGLAAGGRPGRHADPQHAPRRPREGRPDRPGPGLRVLLERRRPRDPAGWLEPQRGHRRRRGGHLGAAAVVGAGEPDADLRRRPRATGGRRRADNTDVWQVASPGPNGSGGTT